MITFAMYVWAFVKEIFLGNKLKDPYSDKSKKEKDVAESMVGGLITRMQRSRPILAGIALALMLSLFVNYRTISKLSVLARGEEDTMEPNMYSPVREKPEQSTSPRPGKKPVKDETVQFLEQLYGVKQ